MSLLEELGWDFTFGLNLQSQRTPDNRWDPTQFMSLLHFTQTHNISINAWELGNEPTMKCYNLPRVMTMLWPRRWSARSNL